MTSLGTGEAPVARVVRTWFVSRGRAVYFGVAGVCDIEDGSPLQPDTIMRIYSMTKPITSVAAMTLYEKGKFQLDDPTSKFIPAFAKTTVLVRQGDAYEIQPTNRQLTVRDLFRPTKGYGYGGGGIPELEAYYRTKASNSDDRRQLAVGLTGSGASPTTSCRRVQICAIRLAFSEKRSTMLGDQQSENRQRT